MDHRIVIRDPTPETGTQRRPRLRPPETLDGRRIALLDIGKTRSDEFLDTIAERLTGRGLEVRRYAKPTNTKVAPADVLQAIATECDLVVEALSD